MTTSGEKPRISSLGFSNRVLNVLCGLWIEYIEELCECTPEQILKTNGCGIKCLEEIRSVLKKFGLSLRNDNLCRKKEKDPKRSISNLKSQISMLKSQINKIEQYIEFDHYNMIVSLYDEIKHLQFRLDVKERK